MKTAKKSNKDVSVDNQDVSMLDHGSAAGTKTKMAMTDPKVARLCLIQDCIQTGALSNEDVKSVLGECEDKPHMPDKTDKAQDDMVTLLKKGGATQQDIDYLSRGVDYVLNGCGYPVHAVLFFTRAMLKELISIYDRTPDPADIDAELVKLCMGMGDPSLRENAETKKSATEGKIGNKNVEDVSDRMALSKDHGASSKDINQGVSVPDGKSTAGTRSTTNVANPLVQSLLRQWIQSGALIKEDIKSVMGEFKDEVKPTIADGTHAASEPLLKNGGANQKEIDDKAE